MNIAMAEDARYWGTKYIRLLKSIVSKSRPLSLNSSYLKNNKYTVLGV